jgi:hypothetical protein
MKANELRIGNKVSFEGSIVTVNTISDDEVTFSDYASLDYPQIEDISGIELTEEWLVMLGFTLINRVDYESNCGVLELEETDAGYLFDSRIIINSLHSLQNLYFALTGEELKLKQA